MNERRYGTPTEIEASLRAILVTTAMLNRGFVSTLHLVEPLVVLYVPESIKAFGRQIGSPCESLLDVVNTWLERRAAQGDLTKIAHVAVDLNELHRKVEHARRVARKMAEN